MEPARAVTLLIGAVLGWLLYIQKTAPGRVEALPPPALVRVMPVFSADLPVTISGQGTVRPRSVVQLTPQVSGRVVSRHPQLLPGGFIAGGSIAVQIDPTDYQLALQQGEAGMQRLEAATQRLQTQQQIAEADLAQARTRLEVEQAEQEVAVWQYQRLHPGQSPQEMPELAAQRPQIRQAEAAVEAARARLADVDQQAQELRAERAQQQAAIEQARVQLARSMVRVPDHDAEHLLYRVLEAEVEVGHGIRRHRGRVGACADGPVA
jgi:multidrug efflux pump subunit AcrA (membrane-fusion protein)